MGAKSLGTPRLGCLQESRLTIRYVPQLQGVLLAHWDHTFQDDTVQLISECPFGIAEVEFDSIIWAPKIGQKLCESSPSLRGGISKSK